MALFDLNEFFQLSAVLHYNLSAAALNRSNVVAYILAGKRLDAAEEGDRARRALLMEALGYLYRAYSHKRRRLGPMAVLHPLRACALMARAQETPRVESLLAVLFHDIQEDVKPVDFEPREWRELEETLYEMLDRLPPGDEAGLVRRLQGLTRIAGEPYTAYIGRLLENAAGGCPDLVEVKLADRLDNTLDMRIDLEDPLAGIDCFQHLFELLFVPHYPGYRPRSEHAPATVMNGARRLHQLFKNAVLLSLIRQAPALPESAGRGALFDALAQASLREAQRSLMHLLGYHLKDLGRQRALVLDAMEYCHSGRSDLVTRPDGRRMLDGLFTIYFAPADGDRLRQQLDLLYANKPLMVEGCIAFLVIFLSFLHDPAYYVRGIRAAGIEAS